MTYKTLILRALAAGLGAGLLLGLYTLTVVEPTIDRAVAAEAAPAEHEHAEGTPAQHDHGEEELFTRDQQKGGGVLATAIYGLVAAGIFATVYAAVRHRLRMGSEVTRVWWLAAVAFATLCLVPAVVYPANPPGVGDGATIGQRTTQYLVLLVLSVLIAVALTQISGWVRTRVAPSAHWASMAAATVVAYGVLVLVMPASPDSIGDGVSTQLLWEFRLRSLGGLALFWLALAAGLGWLLQRHVEQADAAHEVHGSPSRITAS